MVLTTPTAKVHHIKKKEVLHSILGFRSQNLACTRFTSSGSNKCRLEWLGHLVCMPDHRIPKSALFGVVASDTAKMWSEKKVEGCN